MKICPTLALGAILHVRPLLISVKKDACRYVGRMPCITEYKACDFVGHMRIREILWKNPFILVGDHMLPSLVLDRSFNVFIPDMDQWTDQSWGRGREDQVWLTDGLKQTNCDSWAGIMGPGFQRGLANEQTAYDLSGGDLSYPRMQWEMSEEESRGIEIIYNVG